MGTLDSGHEAMSTSPDRGAHLVQRRGKVRQELTITDAGVHVAFFSRRGDASYDVLFPNLGSTRVRSLVFSRGWAWTAGIALFCLVVGLVSRGLGEEIAASASVFWGGIALVALAAFVSRLERQVIVPAAPAALVLRADRPSRAEVEEFLDLLERRRQEWEGRAVITAETGDGRSWEVH